MEEALVARLLAASAISAIVGGRVNWGERPQKEGLPAITLSVISPGRNYTHGGADDLASPRVQIDCWARTYLSAKSLARAVRDTLEPPATQGAIKFSASFLDGERDLGPEDVGGGAKVFRISLDFIVWFSA